MKNHPVKLTRSAAKAPTPLKRRSASGGHGLLSTPASSMKAKERMKTPAMPRNTKVIQRKRESTPADDLPPTIAAGRSRRALKPNPKYNSEDIVTPKNVKLSKKDADMDGKQRKISISSSEESSDEEKLDSEDEKVYTRATRNRNLTNPSEDTDDSEVERPQKQRGRPRKYPAASSAAATPINSRRNTSMGGAASGSSNALNRSVPATRNAPTQLQQLRKTLGAQTVSPLSLGRKRKLEEARPPIAITQKRFHISPGISNKSNNSTTNVMTRRGSPSAQQILSGGNKTFVGNNNRSSIGAKRETEIQEKKTLPVLRSLSSSSSKTSPTSSVKTQPTSSGKTLSTSSARSLPSSSVKTLQSSSVKTLSTSSVRTFPTSIVKSVASSSVKTVQSPSIRTLQTSSVKTLPSSSAVKTLKTHPSAVNSRSFLTGKSQTSQLKSVTSTTTTTTTTNPLSTSKPAVGKTVQATTTATKPNNASSRMTETKPPVIEKELEFDDDVLEIIKPSETIDDFETMPTFTIVNINDFINKKGDVLISETPTPSITTATSKRSTSTATPPSTTTNSPSDTKTERRNVADNSPQQQQKSNKVLASNKISPESVKSSRTPQLRSSTPLLKKPIEKSVTNSSLQRSQSARGRNLPLQTSSTLKSASTTGGSSISEKKPTPRILNSVVGRRTKPIKPVIASLDTTPESPSCSISIDDEDEDDDYEDSISSDDESLERFDTRKRLSTLKKSSNNSSAINKNKKKPTDYPTAAKENSLAATNCLPQSQNQSHPAKTDSRMLSPEKVVVSTQGDKVIKKITCFETWYVINIPEDGPDEYERNVLKMPLIELANGMVDLELPSKVWTSKVTLYELSAASLSKSQLVLYTGDLGEQNIAEENRFKYQPSCVMFRRAVQDRIKSQLPYDRAVIFKNKTFFTNIEGKNVKLVGAPTTINDLQEVETLLHIVDALTLQSPFVEPATTFA